MLARDNGGGRDTFFKTLYVVTNSSNPNTNAITNLTVEVENVVDAGSNDFVESAEVDSPTYTTKSVSGQSGPQTIPWSAFAITGNNPKTSTPTKGK